MKKIDQIKVNKGRIGIHTPFLAGDVLHFRANLAAASDWERTMIAEDVRWHIVPVVSIFESFYKELFAKYIDSGADFSDRIRDLAIDDRDISVRNLLSVTKRTFTIGDIIAYSLKYNSFNEIRKNYEIICRCDYLEKISNYQFKLGPNDMTETLRAQQHVSRIFSDISSMFEMRHCLIHEYPANNVNLSIDRAYELLDHSWLLLMTTDRMMWADTGLKNPFPFDMFGQSPAE